MRVTRRVAAMLALGVLAGAAAAQEDADYGFLGNPAAYLPPDRMPVLAAEECSSAPRGPFRLPPRPMARYALGTIFTDGRSAAWDTLQVIRGRPYWQLDRACAVLGATLLWDPAFFRGEVWIDSIACGFVVGGEVLFLGDRALQMPAPVLYMRNRLLVPLEFVPLMLDSIMPGRFTFRPDSLQLIQELPAAPAAHLRIEQLGRRTYLKWSCGQRPPARFKVDGAGCLLVDLPGLLIDPLDPPAPTPRDGACLWALRPYPGGTEYVFRVDPSIRAWRLQWRTNPLELRLTLSPNQADLAYRTYHPWQAAAQAPDSVNRMGSVVLVVPSLESEMEQERQTGCVHPPSLRALAEQMRGCLEETGLRVIMLDDNPEAHWIPEANALRGGFLLCLRADAVGDELAAGCRIVTAAARPDEHHLERVTTLSERRERAAGTTSAAGRMLAPLRDWDTLFRAYGDHSEELGWLLGLHLEAEFPGVSVRRERWPLAFLGGLDLPGAILYVGDMERDADPTRHRAGSLTDRISAAATRSLERFAARTGIGAGHAAELLLEGAPENKSW